jgi:hypothetical protein
MGTWKRGKFRIVLNPNGAGDIDIRISGGKGIIKPRGHRNKVDSFQPGERVILVFDPYKPIILEN